MDQDHIDALLERYLHLLHEYTTLREELTTLQTGVYQNIARANFAAERGLRFGQDYYDDRMQASRRLAISCKGQHQHQTRDQQSESQDRRNLVPSFTVINPASASNSALRAEDSESNAQAQAQAPNPPSSSSPPHPEADVRAEAEAESVEQDATKQPDIATDININIDDARPQENDKTAISESTPAGAASPPTPEKGATSTSPQKPKDPLRWFGLLTPAPLRQAQAQSIRAVDHVIPRLVSVDVEMAEVEIEVRRARKRRAKAEAAASKRA
ncbi:hypothetical protein F5Y10DRAFT_244391 [Nemania abortiva]|nr:hypothetical protein F5Y10DRAFT_244391 [Nemania abortiva]